MAQLGDDEAAGRLPSDSMAAVHEEAERVAQRLEELVNARRAEIRAAAPSARPALPAGITTGPMPLAPVVGARHSGRLLGNLLVDRGFLTSDEVQYALAIQHHSGQHDSGMPLGQILVELGLLDERVLLELLAEQLRMETIDLRRTTVDRATCVLLPERDARRLCAVPVSRTGRQIDVAIANPTNNVVVRELVETLCAPVRLLLASRSEIEATIDHFHSPAITHP
ncbi:MAG: biosis protein MshE [Actinomycetota bacterium]|nr:biosis protein MshE [Actinomycetota bacterium]